ncbi:hypothetical protein UXP11_22325 [Enterobacter hormaechei]|jgi:hypothetical protein|uniref:SLOG domain-containing protein n=1 Tax=Enterobacteriaceae TaxID=543 RepID=UPI000517279B|nr:MULTISPECIES: hypothetical protein [Enterobacteriaceae]EFE0690303.1 hypothetical protein [Escherichia coli]EIA0558222.1 hypothetical protein [Escherichia coli]KAB8156623.1 hypothetical protein FNV36_19875 [Raoultella ornithinolytica]KAB8165565.1 hypothetical protein FNV35_19730 [Raoultella ornithinolytica]MCF6656927.1 hypothetical protein [Raoultella ornithinolytica]
MGAIFLSASVPVSGRKPFDEDCEPQMIQSAVIALATVAFGRRTIVWGGHPAITPMLWAAAEDLGVQYATAVKLFQTKFFEDYFPEDNKRFANVTFVDAIDNSREQSLHIMREAMLTSESFDAAVFIGGMEGINEEYEIFRQMHPHAKCIPIAVTGGATRELSKRLRYAIPKDLGPLDFIGLLYRELNISPVEARNI